MNGYRIPRNAPGARAFAAEQRAAQKAARKAVERCPTCNTEATSLPGTGMKVCDCGEIAVPE